MAYDGYNKLKVLVIDDFDSFRMTICKMLSELGVEEIDTAYSGTLAVNYCQKRLYDLILCDYNLGMGKNGQQVLEELRSNKVLKRRSLFVLVTAETSKSIILATYDYEPDAYLTKPITGKTLQQRLDRLLKQRDELLPIYDAIDDGDLTRAINLCCVCISSDSRYTAQCQKLLGSLYLETDAYEQADQLFRSVLEVRALDWAQVGLAKVKQAQGSLDVANKWLHDIIANNPMCMQAYDAMADNYKLQGNTDRVQEVLQKVVSISPMSIVRQCDLAETAAENNDIPVAANAYRRTVRLGQHSCHDRVENHLNFGRTAAALFKEDDQLAFELSREALRILGEIPQRFEVSEEVETQTMLIECQVYAGQGNKAKAEEALEEVERSLQSSPQPLSIDTELDRVKALESLERTSQADEMLQELIERYGDDQAALEKIDQLLEEPLSEQNRMRVSKINRNGISLYEQKRYKDAIDCFKQAKRLFPNHLGVHLNMIQALVGEMEEYGRDQSLMELSLATLKKIECRINSTHSQYKRYLQLKDRVKNLDSPKRG